MDGTNNGLDIADDERERSQILADWIIELVDWQDHTLR